MCCGHARMHWKGVGGLPHAGLPASVTNKGSKWDLGREGQVHGNAHSMRAVALLTSDTDTIRLSCRRPLACMRAHTLGLGN